jgi:hypothetical protein
MQQILMTNDCFGSKADFRASRSDFHCVPDGVAKFGLPFVERGAADPAFAANIGRLRSDLLLRNIRMICSFVNRLGFMSIPFQ